MLYYKLYLSTQNACELELSANQKVVDALLPLQGALKQWQLQHRKKKKEKKKNLILQYYPINMSVLLFG